VSDVTANFTYTPASQIATYSRSNDGYAWGGHYNINRAYGTNGLNQLTTAGATALSYDGRGNLTQSGAQYYAYTSENRLVTASQAVGSGSNAALIYDPVGRLQITHNYNSGAHTRFDYVGSDLLSELDSGNVLVRRYVHGPDSAGDDPLLWYEGAGTSDRRWLHADERGSVIGVSNSAGTMIALNAYDEYGIPAATNIGRFGYTGQTWLPEVGLNYYKARIYSPTLGRFLQTDPIGYGDGVNWYDYVDGDPVNRGDPSGLNQRGTGFESDKEWQRFDKAQQKEANKFDKMATRLEAKAAKLDAKHPGAGARKAAAAAHLRTGAAGLRDTSSSAATSNIYTPEQYGAFGRPEGSQAFTVGMTTNFMRGGLGVFGSGGVGTKWIIGHEGLHTSGLLDQRGTNGALAYKGAGQVNTDALRSIRGTTQATINPDSLLNGDN
jgi:RHS repeat-associated protein